MRILHISPNAPYNDYWGYQDNLLPKYHEILGHDVMIITTNTMHKDGKIVETGCVDYELNDGVRVVRLAIKKYPYHIMTNLNARLVGVERYLNDFNPDFIFFHGLVSSTIYDVIKYKKKHANCIVVQDNHLDYNIGRGSDTWKAKAVRSFYRHMTRKTIPYITKIYGVTPWRKAYAEDYFNIPPEKTDVLIMGADDEKINFEKKTEIRECIRMKYNISEDDFLIVTGGKIDQKKKIHFLMQSCSAMKCVKLLIFGQIQDDIKDEFERLCRENENIFYIGWINADKVYDYFFAADLVFFPGQHSVLWEQACASKVPCVFERWEGMEHVNNGGNSDFLEKIDTESIRAKIEELLYTDKYYQMKKIAESDKTDIYLYSRIAVKSLECAIQSEAIRPES